MELLKRDKTLSLKECLWLDAVQKKRPITEDALNILRSKKLIEGRKPNFIISQVVAQKTKQVPEYTKQKGLDKKKLLAMLQQVVENAGEAGIKLNDIYDYMEVTLPVGKSMGEKKRQLRYLLNLLKDEGVVFGVGKMWKSTNLNG